MIEASIDYKLTDVDIILIKFELESSQTRLDYAGSTRTKPRINKFKIRLKNRLKMAIRVVEYPLQRQIMLDYVGSVD